jgi:hypothetical protein
VAKKGGAAPDEDLATDYHRFSRIIGQPLVVSIAKSEEISANPWQKRGAPPRMEVQPQIITDFHEL